MSIKVIRRYYDNYGLENLSSPNINWLLGNVGDWQLLNLDVEAGIDFEASLSETIEGNETAKKLILNNGKEWKDYGFDVGQSCQFRYVYDDDNYNNVLTVISFVIAEIYGNTIVYSNETLLQGVSGDHIRSMNYPFNLGEYKGTDVKVIALVEPEGLKFQYTHLTNEAASTNNLVSLIDQSVTEFIQPNVKGQTIGVVDYFMEAIGKQSGMSIASVKVARYGLKSGSNYIYRYGLLIKFMISTIFDTVENIANNVMPEYLANDGTITDNVKLTFYPRWNNPNASFQNDLSHTVRLGNTGWFNENYNNLNNDFLLESLQYVDSSGNVIPAIDHTQTTKVKAIISGVLNITTATRCGFGFSYLPTNDEEYKLRETPYHRNTFTNTGTLVNDNGYYLVGTLYPNETAGAGINDVYMSVKNVKFTNLGNNRIMFEAEFIPTSTFTSLMESKEQTDRNYVIWASVADRTLYRNFSDRVSIKLDVNTMQKNIPPAGAYTMITNRFIEHPYEEAHEGSLVYNGITQDDVLCRTPFHIMLNEKFEKLTYGIQIKNTTTGQEYELERYEIPLTQYPIQAGVQQIGFNTTRGFKLNSGNNKNFVKINREPAMDMDGMSGYVGYYGFKIRWEDWIANNSVPDDFFSNTELNNGKNNEWYRLQDNGYQMQFFTEIQKYENGEYQVYKNSWKFVFNDYDMNNNIATACRFYKQSTNTPLTVTTDSNTGRPLGVILNTEPTRIEVDFTLQNDNVWDIDAIYGVLTLEKDNGGGIMEQRQISSVWNVEIDNPLKVIAGQTNLQITLSNSNKTATMKAIVDNTLLQTASRYRLSARIGCKDESQIVDFGIYAKEYENEYE